MFRWLTEWFGSVKLLLFKLPSTLLANRQLPLLDNASGLPDVPERHGSHSENRRGDLPTLSDERIDSIISSIEASLQKRQRRRAEYRPGQLHVYVDGKEEGTFDPRATASETLKIPRSATTLEIYGDDAEGRLLLAVFPLAAAAAHEARRTMKFRLSPVRQEDGTLSKEIVRLTYEESLLTKVVMRWERFRQAALAVKTLWQWSWHTMCWSSLWLFAAREISYPKWRPVYALTGGVVAMVLVGVPIWYAKHMEGQAQQVTAVANQMKIYIEEFRYLAQQVAQQGQYDPRDVPFTAEFSPVGPHTLQLHVSLNPTIVWKVFVNWGAFDPLIALQIYPAATSEASVVSGRVLLPAITHAYRPVSREGVRTTVRVWVEPVRFQGERLPHNMFDPITFSSTGSLAVERHLLILPDRIVLDPPPERRPVHPVILDELVEKKLLPKLTDAWSYLACGSPNGSEEAVKLYRAVLDRLSPQTLQQFDQQLLEAANQDAQAGSREAARTYRALFDAYQPGDV